MSSVFALLPMPGIMLQEAQESATVPATAAAKSLVLFFMFPSPFVVPYSSG
jgi:hypothetical protein